MDLSAPSQAKMQFIAPRAPSPPSPSRHQLEIPMQVPIQVSELDIAAEHDIPPVYRFEPPPASRCVAWRRVISFTMAPGKPYFDTVTSETVYDQLYRFAFPTALDGMSTSGWGEDQLAACRVLVAAKTKNNMLPILLKNDCIPTAEFQTLLKQDPTPPEGNNSSDRSTDQLQRICQGPRHHQPQTEHQSAWTYGQSLGQLWASLDSVKASSFHQLSGNGLGEFEEDRDVVAEAQTISDDLVEPDEPDRADEYGEYDESDDSDDSDGMDLDETGEPDRADDHDEIDELDGGDLDKIDEPDRTDESILGDELDGGDGSILNEGTGVVDLHDNPANIHGSSGGDFSRKRKLPEVNSSPPGPRRRRSTRQVKPPHNPGYTPSDQMRFSSSQTSAHPPTSEPEVFYGPPSPKAAQTIYPETLTVRLISSFIRQALPWLPSQNSPEADPVVVFEDAQATFQVKHGEINFTSRDDGGLVIYCEGRRCGRVALLEAKSFVDSYVEGELLLSNKRFGQMVGEALAARFQQDPGVWTGPDGTIIVIAAVRHYLRFLQVGISDTYLTQLKRYAGGGNDAPTEFIRVDGTRWFDLANASDRRYTVQNLEGIVCLVRKGFSRRD
ncbi:hypothetical protein CkaCkLH20_13317 [Colletotrichum karsti]|uniref:Uncharacterized protein n=1 Tax=Colletotrichum karsti TaxID=1095194 RepID=A0A9P6HS28_9PEZI|nr:uncharacterized protein CkaCkLH20_13317 [Colletotrichum karsti]KAF9869208.1 hypothetical protein CkaCkLH20_13317 [Colletotrichum karsti]